jgi:hypothetical protein
MAADGAVFHPVVEADTVGALFAHLAKMQLATVASTAWLYAFDVPDGLGVRPMAMHGAGPAVGLIVLDRKPTSIVADVLESAIAGSDFASIFDNALNHLLE